MPTPNERVYSIKINGISESIDLVEALMKKLSELEVRIDTLSAKTINVTANVSMPEGAVSAPSSSPAPSGGGRNTSELDAEERLQKKIESTVHRIEEARRKEYQTLLDAKNELKETERQQKAIAAAQRLSGEGAKQYANTLDGMREKLSDMKRALGGIDLGGVDFEKQVQEINTLNQKIKDIEQSYGVFGRNVGNYANGVADGMKKLTITVNGTERTFTSAREALKSLGNELKTMAVNGEQSTKEYEELDRVFKQLKSTIDDVSRSSAGMDMLLDTMQGFTALGSVGNGLSTLFGINNEAIDKSIQKMVALQNVMQGVETIRQQMTKNEGIGKIFNQIGDSADMAAVKMTGAKYSIDGISGSSKAATYAVKGLSMALKAVGVGVLLWAIPKAMEQIKELGEDISRTLGRLYDTAKGLLGFSTNGEQTLEEKIAATNNLYEQRKKAIQDNASLSDFDKMVKSIEAGNDALKTQNELLNESVSAGKKLEDAVSLGNFWDNLKSGGGVLGYVKDIAGGYENYIKVSRSAKKSTQELEESVKNMSKSASEDATEMAQRWVKEISQCNLATSEGRAKFEELSNALNDNSVLNSVLLNLDKWIDDEKVREQLRSIIGEIQNLKAAMNNGFNSFVLEIETPLDKAKRQLNEFDKEFLRYANELSKKYGAEGIKKALDRRNELATTVKNGGKTVAASVSKAGKSVAGEVGKQENEINSLRIRLMQDGLRKTLAEIDEEERKEIAALKVSGQHRGEAQELIARYYENKRVEAKRKHNARMVELQIEVNSQLLRLARENAEQLAQIEQTSSNNAIEAVTQNIKLPRGVKENPLYDLYFNDEHPNRTQEFTINFDLALTGDERAKQILEDRGLQEKYWKSMLDAKKITEEEYNANMAALHNATEKDAKGVIKQIDEITLKYIAEMEAADRNKEALEQRRKVLEACAEAAKDDATAMEEYKNEIAKIDEELVKLGDAPAKIATKFTAQIDDAMKTIGMSLYGGLRDVQYESMADLYSDAIQELRKSYYDKVLEKEKEASEKMYNMRKETLERIAELEREELQGQQQQSIGNFELGVEMPDKGGLLERYLKGKSTFDEVSFNFGNVGEQFKEMAADVEEGSAEMEELVQNFYNTLVRYWNEFQIKQQNVNKDETSALLGLDVERAKKDAQTISDYYSKLLSDIERALSATQQKNTRLPDTDAFGIINIKSTRKKLQEQRAAYETLGNMAEQMLQEVKDKFQKGEITVDVFSKLSDAITADINKSRDGIKEAEAAEGNLVGDFLKSIMPYAQELVNGFSGIMGELSNLWNAQYENRMKLLEEENERLQELYEEQEEIEAKHRDNLTAIEDELSTARGARREYLVDQYNEEIAAQRRAVIEKKRLQEEMNRNEAKQKQLEKQELKRQNKIQLAQAMASQSLAIMNAFATTPWPVGLAMGALATTLTAAQLVLMIKAQKESEKYAEGGLLKGKSHKQGGIKLLGGEAEAEGGEYIINKKTTALNEPVIHFINSKKQKLELSDFIDFYSSKQKTIKENFKTKYAEGGMLPTAKVKGNRNVIVVKDESKPVVSVVDIINATDSYNNVRVLAGLED